MKVYNKVWIIVSAFLVMISDLQIQVMNAGIGGNTSRDLLQRIDSDVISHNPDVVLMMIGTNDMVNSNKLISVNEYENNLNHIVNRLEKRNIEVVLISPIPVDTTYLFRRHGRDAYVQPPNTRIETAGNVMRQIAKEKGIFFFDMNREFTDRGIPTHNEDEFIRNEKNSKATDGVHPTPKGYELMANLIYKFMLSNNLVEPGMKVICFGDSITKGVHVKGSGTATGETYPGVLSRLLNQ
ncbi:SGNH/GDSL hydrolase family protein [Rhodohalobacter sp. 614A]|uniref:SGNH/GDSL hydrolase family protein n=1 Tax=Rhodohalobacter sp. 614A TaxID=2908649 RepID=UPI001F3492EE|nr:GDSL-type esterase/lipase family protein [Rhodohalobacter sp. 614A]